jgi:hypothetical protein
MNWGGTSGPLISLWGKKLTRFPGTRLLSWRTGVHARGAAAAGGGLLVTPWHCNQTTLGLLCCAVRPGRRR